jgi:hypothetical protein
VFRRDHWELVRTEPNQIADGKQAHQVDQSFQQCLVKACRIALPPMIALMRGVAKPCPAFAACHSIPAASRRGVVHTPRACLLAGDLLDDDAT